MNSLLIFTLCHLMSLNKEKNYAFRLGGLPAIFSINRQKDEGGEVYSLDKFDL